CREPSYNSGRPDREHVVSYQFEITFDSNVIQPQAQAAETIGTLSNGFIVTTNSTTPGRLRVSAFSSQPLSGQGTLLNLKFMAVGNVGSQSALTWNGNDF